MLATPVKDGIIESPVFSEKVILFLSVLCTVFTIGWVWNFSQYGFEFTDESFYLVWMSNPFINTVSATQFGFVYHPLYEILDGDIAALRRSSFLITYGLSWFLGFLFLRIYFIEPPLRRLHRIIISAAFATTATGSLILTNNWLPTPSYNSLAIQAVLIVAIGLLLSEKNSVGWFLIGVGGWLAFMAKPTTAAALAFTMIVYFSISKRLNIRLLAIPVLVAIILMVLSAFAIDGSVMAFVERLQAGAGMYKTVKAGGHSHLLRLDYFLFDRGATFFLLVSTAFVFFAVKYSQSKNSHLIHGAAAISMFFGLTCIAITMGVTQKTIYTGIFQGLYIWIAPLASLLVGLSIYGVQGFSKLTRFQWALALTFMLFPHAFAFGSGNNYWIMASTGGIFWVFGGLIFLIPVVGQRGFLVLLLPLVLVIQMVSAIQVHNALQNPYRQPQPLYLNDFEVEIGRSGSVLKLSRGFGQYIKDAIELANQSGFPRGTPMIDLTGKSPGVLYAMGAKNIGQVWMVGGYPGSEALAVMMLGKVSCEELATAWLLMEPDGPRKISPEVLLSFGAKLSTDYKIIGILNAAKGVGGFYKVRVQEFLKPIRSATVATSDCIAERKNQILG